MTEIAARLFPSAKETIEDHSEAERVYILQFLFEVDTSVDKHKPIPVAIVRDKDGLLKSVRINQLRVI